MNLSPTLRKKVTSMERGAAPDTNGAALGVATEDLKGAGDDDMQFNVEVDEEPGDIEPIRAETNGKSSSDKRNINRGEEISVPPEGNQVMIRTIPPDIGRVKLEEVHRVMSHIPLIFNINTFS